MLETILNKPTLIYCEKAGAFFIKRPYYALSNIAFLAVGLYILVNEKDSKLKYFGYITVAIATFSTLYDTFDIFIFQILDLAVMLIFVNYLLYLNLNFLIKNREKELLVFSFSAITFGLFPIITIGGLSGSVIFGIFVFLAILSELYIYRKKIRKNYNLWLKGFAFFILGFAFWYTDISKLYCTDFGLLNGRAVFHYLTAITVYYLYKFYKANNSIKS